MHALVEYAEFRAQNSLGEPSANVIDARRSRKRHESRRHCQIPTGLARGFHVQTRGRATFPSLIERK